MRNIAKRIKSLAYVLTFGLNKNGFIQTNRTDLVNAISFPFFSCKCDAGSNNLEMIYLIILRPR